MKLRYIGNGPFIQGVPAKDLETDDPDFAEMLTASGLYVRVIQDPAPKEPETVTTFYPPENEGILWIPSREYPIDVTVESVEKGEPVIDEPELPKKRRKNIPREIEPEAETSPEEDLTINNSE